MKKILFVFLLFSIVNVIVSAEKYAVLITGDYAAKNVPSALRWDTYQEADPTKPGPMECFWNDTYLVWEMLINMGYDNDKIFVLFANGTDYWKVAADAGTPIAERYTPQHIFPDSTDFQITKNYLTNGAATKDNIGLIAQELKDEMHDDDFLFVWTFDHGGFEGLDEMDSLLYPPEGPEVPSYLVLLDPTGLSYDSIYDYEFAQLFNPLLANKKVYWMEQCFSGGFEYEMTHDVCDSTVSYGEHPQLNNVYFISSSQYNMPSYQADNVLAYYENGIEKAETSCYNFYENEYISSKSYLHGEFDFHMLSATKGKKPDNSTEYYDLTIKGVRYNPKYSEVDGYNRLPEYKTNADGVVTVEEAVLWCTDYETNTLGIPEFYPDGTLIDPSPVCSDYENIGHHTSLKYPTIIYDDFYTVGSYLFQPLKGEIAVVEDITIRNGSLSLADNSETVILNSKNIDLKAQLYLQSNSILKGDGNNSIYLMPKCAINADNCVIDNVDLIHDVESGLYSINISGSSKIIQSDIYITNSRDLGSSKIDIVGSSSLTIDGSSTLTMGDKSYLYFGNGSSLLLKKGSTMIMESGSTLVLQNDTEFLVEESANVIFEEGSNLIVEGNARIIGDIQLSGFVNVDIRDYFNLGLQLSDLTINPDTSLKLGVNSKLIIENGSNLIIEDGAVVELSEGAEIIVKNKGKLITNNNTADMVTFALSTSSTGNWKGITCEPGSTLQLNGVEIANAETAVSGLPKTCIIKNSSVDNCESGITVEACDSLLVQSNTLTGIGVGTGISVTHKDGWLIDNTISGFNKGIMAVSCTPYIMDNTISGSKHSGLVVFGLNSVPVLIKPTNLQLPAYYVNNEIFDNGILPDHPVPTVSMPGQICVLQGSSIMMKYGHNNVYSNPKNVVPEIPCLVAAKLTPEGQIPRIQILNIQSNYWGSANVTDDFFVEGGGYVISYDPYHTWPWGQIPIFSTYPEPDSKPYKLLLKALEAELDGKYDKAIKIYEKIIEKYSDSDEAVVAYAKLPDNYRELKLDLNPLLSLYDEQLASDDDTVNKKFFKEMKVATHIKSKKYDSAIILAEEMKAEAESEDEIILCDIDIAICNMMKDAENEGKGRSSNNNLVINELLSKLTGDDEKSEPASITENVLPTECKLYQNYPNPFNPVTQLRFDLAKTSNVKLSVYNISGQKVADLANEVRQAGHHIVDFDGSKLNSGIYYYTLEADGKSLTKKMILMK